MNTAAVLRQLAGIALFTAASTAWVGVAFATPAESAYELGVHHYKKGDYAKAAGLFRDAYKLDPTKAVYLYNAGRAEHKRGELQAALKTYREVLEHKQLEPAIELRARRFSDEVEAALKAREAKAAAQAQARAAEAARLKKQQELAAAVRTRKYMGYGGVGAGAALLGVGGWLLASWSADQAALDDRVDKKDASGKVIGISSDAYTAEQDRIDLLGISGAAAAGVGVVAAGLGAWWLLSADAPADVSISPDPVNRGLLLRASS